MARTLIQGGCVLTLGRVNFPEADVLIDGTTIAEVGPGLRDRSAEVVDATDTIVMPGFVDSHRHVAATLFRHIDAALSDVGPHYEPDDVYSATLVGLVGSLDAGTTSVVDWCDVATSRSHVEAAWQAHADSGIRTVLALAADGRLPELARLDNDDDNLRGLAAGTTDPDQWETARAGGLRIHHHTGGSLAGTGPLGDDVTIVHGAHLTDADLAAVAASGAAVVVTPADEMAGGMGQPRMQAMIDQGIRPGLGVGRDQMAPGDMFAQMRAAISLQHGAYFDLKLAGKAGLPRLLTTREVIRYATADGARAAGFDPASGPGVLEPGRPADLVLLRTDRPNIWPINDPIGAVVWGMDTSNVDWVFIAGRALKRNGVLDADVESIRQSAAAARQRVGAAAGILATSEGPA